MKIEVIRPDFSFHCINKKALSGCKIEDGELIEEGRVISDKIDVYINTNEINAYNIEKAPESGEFNLPFLVIGYHGKGQSYDEGLAEGIEYMKNKTDEIEQILILSGCKEVVKIVKYPIDIINDGGEAIMGEQVAFVGYS